MSDPGGRWVRGDGIAIHLTVWKGPDRPILCIHGLTANGRCWDTIAAVLAAHRTLAAPDLRGRGRSEQPATGYSVDHHCRDIEALMDALGVSQAALMGHSLGALIALVFAARNPARVERLVLVDGAGGLTSEQTRKVFESIRPALERLGRVYSNFSDYLAPLRRTPFLQPWNAALETYFEHETEFIPEGVRCRTRPETIAEEIENLKAVAAPDHYARVRCPTLIFRATEGMLADDDLVLPREAAQRMIAEIPNARCVDIPAVNHYTIMFHPNKLRDRELLDFLLP